MSKVNDKHVLRQKQWDRFDEGSWEELEEEKKGKFKQFYFNEKGIF